MRGQFTRKYAGRGFRQSGLKTGVVFGDGGNLQENMEGKASEKWS